MNAILCARCGTQNAAGAAFCSQCGAGVTPATGNRNCRCGTVYQGRFCPACGTAAPAGQVPMKPKVIRTQNNPAAIATLEEDGVDFWVIRVPKTVPVPSAGGKSLIVGVASCATPSGVKCTACVFMPTK